VEDPRVPLAADADVEADEPRKRLRRLLPDFSQESFQDSSQVATLCAQIVRLPSSQQHHLVDQLLKSDELRGYLITLASMQASSPRKTQGKHWKREKRNYLFLSSLLVCRRFELRPGQCYWDRRSLVSLFYFGRPQPTT
jgi:hypothetical protein